MIDWLILGALLLNSIGLLILAFAMLRISKVVRWILDHL